jgi:nitrogenase-stabilizing/protective protein
VPTTDPMRGDLAAVDVTGSGSTGTGLTGSGSTGTGLTGSGSTGTGLTGIELSARLLACRDAEDYFAVLDVPFDPQVLRVNRLHVLRLFGPALQEYLATPGDAERAVQQLRAALVAAHDAFTSATALDRRLFKVLQDHAPRGFVPLDEVTVESPPPAGSSWPAVTR